jgi:hypothetical protein
MRCHVLCSYNHICKLLQKDSIIRMLDVFVIILANCYKKIAFIRMSTWLASEHGIPDFWCPFLVRERGFVPAMRAWTKYNRGFSALASMPCFVIIFANGYKKIASFEPCHVSVIIFANFYKKRVSFESSHRAMSCFCNHLCKLLQKESIIRVIASSMPCFCNHLCKLLQMIASFEWTHG